MSDELRRLSDGQYADAAWFDAMASHYATHIAIPGIMRIINEHFPHISQKAAHDSQPTKGGALKT